VAGTQHGDDTSGYIRSGEFLDRHLLKKELKSPHSIVIQKSPSGISQWYSAGLRAG
jgi:hypothetical protein